MPTQTSDAMTDSAKLIVPRLLQVILVLSVALAAMTVITIALTVFVFKKKVETFAMSESGRVIPLIPLDTPYVNDSRVSGFTEECLRTSFAHDPENYVLTMATAKGCYTALGAENFEIQMAPLLADIKKESVVMSSSFEPTVVTRVYKLGGVVQWDLLTPMVLYRKGTRKALQPVKFDVTTTVTRVPLEDNVRGISLRRINLRPAS